MSFLTAYFYDKIMADTEEACLKDWRKALLKEVSGSVLEIGAGTGANLSFYPETNIQLILSEPDKNMRKQLATKVDSFELDYVSVSDGSAEDIPSKDGTFDVVVASLVCCSVKNLEAALIEIKRVLKTGGVLIFMEHVAAKSGSRRRRWQNIINPIWRKLAGNCHLNRETEQAMLSAGFEFKEIKRQSMRKAMPLVRPTIRGVALKNSD